jgi:hypothetical protein
MDGTTGKRADSICCRRPPKIVRPAEGLDAARYKAYFRFIVEDITQLIKIVRSQYSSASRNAIYGELVSETP